MSCRKPVIDFTTWEREAVIAYFRTAPQTCGQFTVEQLEPGLLRFAERTAPLRKGFLAAVTALAIQSSSAQEPIPAAAPMEQVAGSKPDPSRTKGSIDGVVIANKADGPYCVKPASKPASTDRYRLYVSGRFPFLHVRRRTLRGRVIGCPSF
ncbi:MAG: hypothetical protein R2818_09185 [Flavobacteriales bacterium]